MALNTSLSLSVAAVLILPNLSLYSPCVANDAKESSVLSVPPSGGAGGRLRRRRRSAAIAFFRPESERERERERQEECSIKPYSKLRL